MGSRFLRDQVNQTELKFSDHCDLEDVAIYINPTEDNDDHDQVGMCCVVKRADLEKLMWWHTCTKEIAMNPYESIIDKVEELYTFMRDKNISLEFAQNRCYEYAQQLMVAEFRDKDVNMVVRILVSAIQRSDEKFFSRSK